LKFRNVANIVVEGMQVH